MLVGKFRLFFASARSTVFRRRNGPPHHTNRHRVDKNVGEIQILRSNRYPNCSDVHSDVSGRGTSSKSRVHKLGAQFIMIQVVQTISFDNKKSLESVACERFSGKAMEQRVCRCWIRNCGSHAALRAANRFLEKFPQETPGNRFW